MFKLKNIIQFSCKSQIQSSYHKKVIDSEEISVKRKYFSKPSMWRKPIGGIPIGHCPMPIILFSNKKQLVNFSLFFFLFLSFFAPLSLLRQSHRRGQFSQLIQSLLNSAPRQLFLVYSFSFKLLVLSFTYSDSKVWTLEGVSLVEQHI